MACMVTGHRKIVPSNLVGSPWPGQNPAVAIHHQAVKAAMAQFIADKHLRSGISSFISGMALGADQLFAETVIELQASGMPIHLVAAVPFMGQESNWPAKSQAKFQAILAKASDVTYVCDPGYAPWKMQTRNVWMVDNSTCTLAVWDGKQSGGTWNCLQYAMKQNNIIEVLNPMTLEFSVLKG
jgi:uncharacterized phage-like protein YoqJ